MPDKGKIARNKITDAARMLFYHKGYGATSYADIAAQTGYRKGNIHYYFNSKEEILQAVTAVRLVDYHTVLKCWERQCSSPFSCLDKFIEMFANSADNLAIFGCPMGTLNDELGKGDSELQQDTRRMFDLFLNWLEKQFSKLYPKGKAKMHAEHLMVLAQGISVLAHAYRDEALVIRQTKMVRAWLKEVCSPSPN